MSEPTPAEQVSEDEWKALHEALELFVAGVFLAWTDPAFSLEADYNPFRRNPWKVVTTVRDEATGVRLPKTGVIVRGAAGTKVDINHIPDPISVRDAVHATSSYLRPHEPYVQRVLSGQALIRHTLGRSRQLLRAIRLCAYGPQGAANFEELDSIPNQVLPPYLLEAMQIESLVATILERRGITADNITSVLDEDVSAVATETVDALREAINVAHFRFAVIALLNGPPIDAEEHLVIEGSWYGRPFRVCLGYPDDSLCSGVISRVGRPGLFVPDHLAVLNCYVRIEYELPSSVSADEMTAAHVQAGEYVRRAVDILRLLCADDVGIVYLAGFPATSDFHEPRTLVPPFSEYFPERPDLMYRTPMRRIFDPPSPQPLSSTLLEEFSVLFETWGLKPPAISGLPVAMERLRGIYDRYAPEETGRLVDAVTGLEALYLPDSSTSELRYRLVTRAAWFLAPGAENLDARTAVAKELGDIYSARSSLVHTGQLTSKQQRRAKELADRAVLYLRLSLLRFVRTRFGAGVGSNELGERWMHITMGESTLKRVDVPPATPRAEGPEVSTPAASSEPPPV